MRLLEKRLRGSGRGDVFEFYPLGDIHLGARSCAETPLRRLVAQIKDNSNAYIIGGGDWVDAIRPQDSKRFDFDTLPDWLVEGDAMTTREKLNDIIQQQVDRIVDIMYPVRDKIIGIIEGNHEFSVKKYAGLDIHRAICRKLEVESLTDETLLRLTFSRNGNPKGTSSVVIVYARHGYGGGRMPGAEPNKLDRMLNEWECADICITGHTHTADELPPKPVLEIPRSGKLPPECYCRYRHALNWGCWVYSHPSGASSYASRACYPARPMLTYKICIRPFHAVKRQANNVRYWHDCPEIEIRRIPIK